jgi:G3E family GTPase
MPTPSAPITIAALAAELGITVADISRAVSAAVRKQGSSANVLAAAQGRTNANVVLTGAFADRLRASRAEYQCQARLTEQDHLRDEIEEQAVELAFEDLAARFAPAADPDKFAAFVEHLAAAADARAHRLTA